MYITDFCIVYGVYSTSPVTVLEFSSLIGFGWCLGKNCSYSFSFSWMAKYNFKRYAGSGRLQQWWGWSADGPCTDGRQ